MKEVISMQLFKQGKETKTYYKMYNLAHKYVDMFNEACASDPARKQVGMKPVECLLMMQVVLAKEILMWMHPKDVAQSAMHRMMLKAHDNILNLKKIRKK